MEKSAKQNRFTDWAIIYSPQDKENLNETRIKQLIKVLKKNSILYTISYETGDKGQNPHWDIVVRFKTKQARGDLITKFQSILDTMERPATVCTKITDFKQRIGYNLKENLDFPFSIDETSDLSDEFRQSCITYYNEWCKTQEQNNKIKNTFKFIQHKNALYEINKFIILSEVENIDNEAKLKTIITKMLLEGYYFDMKAIQKRKMVKAYLAYYNNDQSYLQGDINEWFKDETHDYRCHNCQHINEI